MGIGFTNVILAENELLKQKQKEVIEMINDWYNKQNNIQLIKIHEAEQQTGIMTLIKDIEKKLKLEEKGNM